MVLTDGQPVEADWSSPAVYLHKYDMFFFKILLHHLYSI